MVQLVIANYDPDDSIFAHKGFFGLVLEIIKVCNSENVEERGRLFLKSNGISVDELPVQKRVRSKLIQRVQTTMNASTSKVEANSQDAVSVGRIPRRGQSNAICKVPRGGNKKKRRTGPGGKIAMVSDEAVERITADFEKRTRRAIRLIGHSRGF